MKVWIRHALVLGGLAVLPAHAVGEVITLSSTNFEGFNVGQSVNGQGGWGVTNLNVDQSVVTDGTNTVWRISNASTFGSFGDMPFAPRPGGIPTDTVNNPTNSNPNSFAGESSTGAAHTRFFGQFDFKSASSEHQPGLRVTVSPDSGNGGRQGFFALEDTASGLAVTTSDVNPDGTFAGPFTIASDLNRDTFHTIGVEVFFNDGPNNDVVNYFLNGNLIHTDTSWEAFIRLPSSPCIRWACRCKPSCFAPQELRLPAPWGLAFSSTTC